MRALQKIALIALPLMLAACASGSSAIWQTLQNVWANGGDVSKSALNPNLRYLRVVVEGRILLMALGYTDPHPLGPVEVWYSAEKETLRLQNGRIVGITGVKTEWRSVAMPVLPAWSEVSKASAPIRWIRGRDVMPGYRYGIKDAMLTYPILPPGKSQLMGLNSTSLIWFEEREESALGSAWLRRETGDTLPPTRYAVAVVNGTESVLYSEACVAPELCFSWQRWPVPDLADGKR
jgi:hypothetical protein